MSAPVLGHDTESAGIVSDLMCSEVVGGGFRRGGVGGGMAPYVRATQGDGGGCSAVSAVVSYFGDIFTADSMCAGGKSAKESYSRRTAKVSTMSTQSSEKETRTEFSIRRAALSQPKPCNRAIARRYETLCEMFISAFWISGD